MSGHDDWRQPGCAETCVRIVVPMIGGLTWEPLEVHDPLAHERYMQRIMAPPSTRIRCGPITLDIDDRRLWVDGAAVRTSPTEWRLIRLLAERAGSVVSHADLWATVWPDCAESSVDRRVIRLAVVDLRRKLGPRRALIQTRFGFGYQLASRHAANEIRRAA